MNIEGAILDLDGTLLDSMSAWTTVGEAYLRSRGLEPREDLNRRFRNLSLAQAACYYRKEYGLTESVDEIVDGVNAIMRRFYTEKVLPKKGVPEFLEKLKKRNVKLCVATATDRPLAEAALSRSGLLSYFGEIFTCGQIGRGKDEPDIYHAAHRFLNTPKPATWVFEDALYAAITAKAAGFPVVGVYDPYTDRGEAIRAVADRYIRSFAEMEDILE